MPGRMHSITRRVQLAVVFCVPTQVFSNSHAQIALEDHTSIRYGWTRVRDLKLLSASGSNLGFSYFEDFN